MAHFEQLPDEPIMIVTLPANYRMETDFQGASVQYQQVLDSAQEKVYWIVDTREWLFDLEQLMLGATTVARGEGSIYHHPNIKQVLYVTTNEILPAAAKGLASDAFGHLDIKIFGSVDDAIAYARADRAANS